MDAATSQAREGGPLNGRWLASAVAAVALVTVAVLMVATQVEVKDPATGVTRTCGSAFDSVADRSGWETWWARDLDDPDDAVRSALVRTTRCPDAINTRLAIGATLVGLAVLLIVVVLWTANRQRRQTAGSGRADRIVRLGRVTSYVGALLTIAGLLAIVLLVADADSTLFLYTDRLVVGVVGLIVLVPTVALFVIGRALVILGRTDPVDTEPEVVDA